LVGSTRELALTIVREEKIIVMGWVRAFRSNRFVALNDGSTLNNLQLVVDFQQHDESLIKRISVGAAIKATGIIMPSQGAGQKMELQVTALEILGDCDA